jgi:DNA-binding MarR family transcriptional regulator
MDVTSTNARRFLYLLDRLRHQRSGPAFQRLRALNLSHSHMALIRILAPDHELAMKDLADRLQLTPPSVTALTRRLVLIGLVERRPHAEDSRVALLSLTDAGRDLHWQLYHEQIQAMESLLAGLSDEEQQLFLDLLARAVRFAMGESLNMECLGALTPQPHLPHAGEGVGG